MLTATHDLPIPVLVAIVLVLLFFLSVSLFMKLRQFWKELTYINKEIRRSTGSEKKYWINQKKNLWRSFLPFHKM